MARFFLDFHIVPIDTEIRIHSLSESLHGSISNFRAAVPLMRPIDMFGHSRSVDFCHKLLAVFQVKDCPLLSHFSHKCCSLSITPTLSDFLHAEHIALSVRPGILFQYEPHFIFPVSIPLMWSLMRGVIFSDL